MGTANKNSSKTAHVMGLMEAKAQLSHGEWLPWLEDRVEISERVAQNFMRLARNYSNPNTLSDLGASKALMLLALPEEARDEFISVPHLVDGEEKSVADMTARELQSVLKERDEARKAAEQAKAEQSAAEQAWEKMARDMAVANERIAGLNAEVEERATKLNEARGSIARLEQELKELRARPVEVAVEADAAAIEAARREAEEKVRAQSEEKIKAAREAAQAQVLEAKRDFDQARLERERALNERDALLARAEQAEKKASIAANEDLVLFKAFFEQAQDQVNKMSGVLMKLRPKDPDAAGRLSQALLALSDKVREVAAQ